MTNGSVLLTAHRSPLTANADRIPALFGKERPMAGSRRKKGSTDLPDPSRRTFLKQTAATVAVSPLLIQDAKAQTTPDTAGHINVTLRVNGKDHRIQIEPRV